MLKIGIFALAWALAAVLAGAPLGDAVIRIGVVSSYPPMSCGIAEFTRNMLRAIKASQQARVQIEVFSISRHPYTGPPPVEKDIRVRQFVLTPKTELKVLSGIARQVNRKQLDVLFVQHEAGLMWDAAHYASLLQHISRRTTILSFVHTGAPYTTFARRKAMQQLANSSDYLVALGWKVKYALTHFYGIPAFKVLFFPHGVYKPKVGVTRKRAAKVTFLMSGIMRPMKGVFETVEALRILKTRQQLKNIRVLIVGRDDLNGELRAQVLRKAAACGVGAHLTWHYGYKSIRELTKYHLTADAFLAPFNVEVPTSGTLSFAMACGLPVIATPFGLSGELLGLSAATPEYTAVSLKQDRRPGTVRRTKYGVLVPYDNVAALANAIHQLAQSPKQRRAMGRRCQRLMHRITWFRVGQALVRFLRTGRLANRLMPNNFRNHMRATRARWTQKHRIDLGHRRVPSLPNGAYCLYLDSFVAINALIRQQKIVELGVRVIEYRPGPRSAKGAELFIYADSQRRLPQRKRHAISTDLHRYIRYLAPPGTRALAKTKKGVKITTPNLVFSIARENGRSLALVVHRVSRFAAARGVLGSPVIKRFSGRHQQDPRYAPKTWALGDWNTEVFKITTDLPHSSWCKGMFYGLPRFTRRNIQQRVPQSPNLFSVDLKNLFANTATGKTARTELLKRWCNRGSPISLGVPSLRQSIRQHPLETYVIKQLIKEGLSA